MKTTVIKTRTKCDGESDKDSNSDSVNDNDKETVTLWVIINLDLARIKLTINNQKLIINQLLCSCGSFQKSLIIRELNNLTRPLKSVTCFCFKPR